MDVLLGVGGSDDSFRALDWALRRVPAAGDDLTVAVVENPESERDPEAVEAEVRERLAAAGVDAPVVHLSGDPGSALVEHAEAEGFDELVVGGGEESPMGKIRLGNVSEFILLNSHVTVTLVR
jgi:nucleotide-binding universal stress UspA family protein